MSGKFQMILHMTSRNVDMLKFLQTNLQHSRAARLIFASTFVSESIKVGLITEPYYAKGKIRNQSGGEMIYHSSSEERPRASIYLNIDLRALF